MMTKEEILAARRHVQEKANRCAQDAKRSKRHFIMMTIVGVVTAMIDFTSGALCYFIRQLLIAPVILFAVGAFMLYRAHYSLRYSRYFWNEYMKLRQSYLDRVNDWDKILKDWRLQ